MIRCTLSTDGQYLISGSESGNPYVWDASLENPLDTREFECKFQDVVSDCDWNPRYNMFAVCGFGQEFPVLIYVYERTLKEVEELLYNFGRLTPMIDAQN